ncbi:hypothetical protein [Ascidiimonas sp. W6]|uniref:hypothetical protein n=1 Tax=Ascidiimonas meishanensis TaxID=3128903 RepID=UPI0030EDF1B9
MKSEEKNDADNPTTQDAVQQEKIKQELESLNTLSTIPPGEKQVKQGKSYAMKTEQLVKNDQGNIELAEKTLQVKTKEGGVFDKLNFLLQYSRNDQIKKAVTLKHSPIITAEKYLQKFDMTVLENWKKNNPEPEKKDRKAHRQWKEDSIKIANQSREQIRKPLDNAVIKRDTEISKTQKQTSSFAENNKSTFANSKALSFVQRHQKVMDMAAKADPLMRKLQDGDSIKDTHTRRFEALDTALNLRETNVLINAGIIKKAGDPIFISGEDEFLNDNLNEREKVKREDTIAKLKKIKSDIKGLEKQKDSDKLDEIVEELEKFKNQEPSYRLEDVYTAQDIQTKIPDLQDLLRNPEFGHIPDIDHANAEILKINEEVALLKSEEKEIGNTNWKRLKENATNDNEKKDIEQKQQASKNKKAGINKQISQINKPLPKLEKYKEIFDTIQNLEKIKSAISQEVSKSKVPSEFTELADSVKNIFNLNDKEKSKAIVNITEKLNEIIQKERNQIVDVRLLPQLKQSGKGTRTAAEGLKSTKDAWGEADLTAYQSVGRDENRVLFTDKASIDIKAKERIDKKAETTSTSEDTDSEEKVKETAEVNSEFYLSVDHYETAIPIQPVDTDYAKRTGYKDTLKEKGLQKDQIPFEEGMAVSTSMPSLANTATSSTTESTNSLSSLDSNGKTSSVVSNLASLKEVSNSTEQKEHIATIPENANKKKSTPKKERSKSPKKSS